MNAQASITDWQLEALKHESFKHFVETHQLAGEAQLITCHPKGDSHRLPAAGKVRRPSHSRLQKAPRIMAGPLAANRQKGRIIVVVIVIILSYHYYYIIIIIVIFWISCVPAVNEQKTLVIVL